MRATSMGAARALIECGCRSTTAISTSSAMSITRRVPLTELRVSEPLSHAPRIVTLGDGAFCEIADNAAFSQILAASGHRDSLVVSWQSRWRGAVVALHRLDCVPVRCVSVGAARRRRVRRVAGTADVGRAAWPRSDRVPRKAHFFHHAVAERAARRAEQIASTQSHRKTDETMRSAFAPRRSGRTRSRFRAA